MSISDEQYRKFAKITFEDFRRMANDDSLSRYEKIGGPDSYLKGKGEIVFQSVITSLRRLTLDGQTVLDIGSGCGDLAHSLIDLCRQKNHRLLLVDSEEMLAQLPDERFISKFPAYFPQCERLFAEYLSKVNVVIAYSVFHYVFAEGNAWDFVDGALELLAEGGELLIGDIPNGSKRRRFFSSTLGIRFHQQFMNTQEVPDVRFNTIERHRIDDSVILALLTRVRNQGFDAYVLPQGPELPMANRREDILVRRP